MMQTNWTIRAVEAADGPIVCRHRFNAAETPDGHYSCYLSWLELALAGGTYVGLVARCDAHVIAGAGLVLLDWGPTRDDPGYLRGRIVNVFTEPEWRRQGVARQLIEELIRLGEQAGIGTFSLGASEKGATLYRQLGFVRYEEEMLRRG
ncbi:GNAT superfamily N-acetyltransferase [Actimicrobium sp. GrIS 1.19]|uniref:GNAT family N-acetyltransferase n=1 Tax=Actimicrobium sp. GrIS 1.19 TaxID=3071708 RepID=UPI002DFBFF53|nr:GNAT superfamily N-acetyltransferase [Actimicrobium sp. GrIS 1.19]